MAKYQVVDRKDLAVDDVVTVINLASGSLFRDYGKDMTDVRITKVDWNAPSDQGFSYKVVGDRYDKTVGSSRVKSLLFLKNTEVKPANWPPERDDVWKIGDRIWHSMCGGMWIYGGGTASASAEDLLIEAAGKAELLFRVKK
jgi:hypothetical protein